MSMNECLNQHTLEKNTSFIVEIIHKMNRVQKVRDSGALSPKCYVLF